MMESFKLTIEKRNKLYFNQYKYRAKAYLPGVGYTYYTADIETYIERLEKWKSIDLEHAKSKYWQESNLLRPNIYNEIKYDMIEYYIDFRNRMPKTKMISRIENQSVSFFSNDLNLFKPLFHIDPNLKLTEAEVLSPGTIYLSKSPKHKFRTYFKGKRAPENFFENVVEFNGRYPSASISKGLLRWISSRRNNWNKYMYMHGSYYVDYDDESMISILHMIFGNMIGKTYRLDKRPKD